MRLRKQERGNKNIIGAKVEEIRKQQGMKQKELLAQLLAHVTRSEVRSVV